MPEFVLERHLDNDLDLDRDFDTGMGPNGGFNLIVDNRNKDTVMVSHKVQGSDWDALSRRVRFESPCCNCQ